MKESIRYNLKILIGFISLMLLMHLTSFDIVPVSDYLSIDVLIIPVIFLIILTDRNISLIAGITWGFLAGISPIIKAPFLLIFISRIITAILGHEVFIKIADKEDTTMTTKIFITIIFTNLVLYVIDIATISIQIRKQQLFMDYAINVLIKKTIPTIIYLMGLDLLLKYKLRVKFYGNDTEDVRVTVKKRNYKRVNLPPKTIVQFKLGDDKNFKQGLGVDISCGGILIKTNKDASIGDSIKLKAKSIINNNLITGEVVRVSGGELAVRFNNLTDSVKKKLKKYVANQGGTTDNNGFYYVDVN